METKEFKIVKSERDCQRGVKLNDGRVIVIWGLKEDEIFLRFDDTILLDGKITTCNDIIAEGKGVEVFGYKQYYIETKSKYPKKLSKTAIKEIIKEFKKNGFCVTESAIRHNFECWQEDLKSGFRDSKNGYHLFTPCGCNRLSFTATELREGLEDWQKTYWC